MRLPNTEDTALSTSLRVWRDTFMRRRGFGLDARLYVMHEHEVVRHGGKTSVEIAIERSL